MTTAAVVLAAGAGERFDGGVHKLLQIVDGRPVVAHAVDAAVGAGLDATIVVTGAVDLRAILEDRTAAIGDLAVVANPHWGEGIATSLQAGIAAARAAGHDAIVVGLADQPFVTSDAWRAVAATDAPIVVATYGGRRGNPVRLAEAVWALVPTTGDEGARVLMRERPELVREVPCPGDPADIDTVEDLRRWS